MMNCVFEFLPVFSNEQLLLISKALAYYHDSLPRGSGSLDAGTLALQLRQYLTADKLVLQSQFKRDNDLAFDSSLSKE